MSEPERPSMDLTHDVLRHGHQPLAPFFFPGSVAVIGASEKRDSVGRTILWNLVSSPFGGTVFPVNNKRPSVLGIKAYPSIGAVPDKVDLAIIVVPAQGVPEVVRECVAAGVKAAIVISAGFKELGPSGLELEQRVFSEAKQGKLRIIGPNCLGLMNPITGLNATFASTIAKPGKVGFISQSGALCTAVLDWSMHENVGFSAFVSIGSMVDVDWGDLIQHLGGDPNTQSIVIYMETIGNARSFLSAAREIALTKPIIVIKAGRTELAAKAAASHTGSLAGSDEVLDAAFRRSGVLRVDTIEDLFQMAEVLGKQPRPKGPRLTIVTNAGGPGVIATDALISSGGRLAQLSPETVAELDSILPPHWSRGNPVDILGDAEPARFEKTVAIAAKDPQSDGLLVILTPQAMTDPSQTAANIGKHASLEDRPILASWMGGREVAEGDAFLTRANVPTFPYPDIAARAFHYMWLYSDNLQHLYETPIHDPARGEVDVKAAAKLIDGVCRSGRTLLTELESKNLLSAYGIPVVQTVQAWTPDEAVSAAEKLGYPAVVKLNSETITHKTDVGGVELNLAGPEEVRQAFAAIEQRVEEKAGKGNFLGVTVQPMVSMTGYELIIGSSLDAQFGPVLLFGSGGQLVEVFRDRALALPPLNTTLARAMIERTKIHAALKGVRGRESVNLSELEHLLVRFSRMVVEQPRIKEIDINPLLASPGKLLALDARVVLHGRSVPDARLPRPAIRPYPIQYVWPETATGTGKKIDIRPIRPEDEPLVVQFHGQLSERSVFLRFASQMPLSERVTHERMTRICHIDYDREIALVADFRDEASGRHEVAGIARLARTHGTNGASFALVVRDDWQKTGLGTRLFEKLLEVAKGEKLAFLGAQVRKENAGMLRICEKAGCRFAEGADGASVRAELEL